jgi:hypothetical protein
MNNAKGQRKMSLSFLQQLASATCTRAKKLKRHTQEGDGTATELETQSYGLRSDPKAAPASLKLSSLFELHLLMHKPAQKVHELTESPIASRVLRFLSANLRKHQTKRKILQLQSGLSLLGGIGISEVKINLQPAKKAPEHKTDSRSITLARVISPE